MASSVSRSLFGRLIFSGRRTAALGAPAVLRRTFTEAVARGPAPRSASFSSSSSSDDVRIPVLDMMKYKNYSVMAPQKNWEPREDKDSMLLRFDMPGVEKEHVQVNVREDMLIVKGSDVSPPAGRERIFVNRVKLDHMHRYKIDQIRTEMKNGVLKVVLPKA